MNDDAFLKEGNGNQDEEDRDKFTDNLEERGDSEIGMNIFGQDRDGGDHGFKSKRTIRTTTEQGLTVKSRVNNPFEHDSEGVPSPQKRPRGGHEDISPAQVQVQIMGIPEDEPDDYETNKPMQKFSRVAPLDRLYNLEFQVNNQKF